MQEGLLKRNNKHSLKYLYDENNKTLRGFESTH